VIVYLSIGTHGLGLLPDSHQLQAISISQFTPGLHEPASQTVSDVVISSVGAHTTSATLQTPQGSTDGSSSLANVSTNVGSHAGSSSWLFGDYPALPCPSSRASDLTSSAIDIGDSLPYISKKLFQQIKSVEYVDFTELPPARARPTKWHTSRMSTLELFQLQDLNRQQKLVPNFLTWSQCFAVYAAVLATEQPQRVPELMGYQFEISQYVRKHRWPSWVIFDLNFRQRAACKPTLPWAEAVGHRESKLYSQCFTGISKDTQESWCKTCQSRTNPLPCAH